MTAQKPDYLVQDFEVTHYTRLTTSGGYPGMWRWSGARWSVGLNRTGGAACGLAAGFEGSGHVS